MTTRFGLATAAGIALAFYAFEANAAPFPAVPLTDAPEVTKVAQGCGPGMRRGRFGQCRPMGRRFVRPGRRDVIRRCVVRVTPRGRERICTTRSF